MRETIWLLTAAATLKPGDYVLICGGPAGVLATGIYITGGRRVVVK